MKLKNKMKITLILHKYAVPLNDPCCYPLGYMYISSALKKQGHEVKILNYNLWDYDLKEELKDQDIACFTGFEEFLPAIKKDVKLCKELGVNTILGGALATFLPHQMIKLVDMVTVGEADNINTFQNAITVYAKPKLDQLPLPDYEGFGISEYHKRHEFNYMGILTSRGCPFNCTFCSHTCTFQYRNLSNVKEEIELYIDKYKIESLVINDNTLNVSKERFLNICNMLKPYHITWSAAIRLDNLDTEMLSAAKGSGCNYFVVGVESFKQEKLDAINKRIKVEQINNSLNLLHDFNINYHGNVLVGFKNETLKDIEEELSLIPKHCNIFPVFVRPFIGTKEGDEHLLSEFDRDNLNNKFMKHIYSKGKYCYPDLEKAI